MTRLAAALRYLAAADAGRYAISSVVVFAGTGMLNVVVANALGPAGKGQVSLALTAVAIVGTLSTLGIELSLCRTLSGDAARIPSIGWLITAVGALAFALGAASVLVLNAVDAGLADSGTLALVAIASCSATILVVSTNLLVAVRASRRVLLSRTAGAIVTLGAAVGLVVAGAGLKGVLAAVTAGACVTVAAQVPAWPRGRRVVTGRTRAVVMSGLRTHLGTVMQSLAYRIDLFIVAALLGKAALGVYSIAVMLTQLLWFIPDALGMTLLQRTAAGAAGAGDHGFGRALRLAVASTATCAVALGATAWLVVPAVFGEGFSGAYVPLLWLLPGTVALAVWKLAVNYLFARGHDLTKTISAILAAVTGVGLDFVLIPLLGLTGAAIAASAGYGVAALAVLIELRVREGRRRRASCRAVRHEHSWR